MRSAASRERPVAPGDDDLRPATGILIGLAISILVWLLLLWLLLLWLAW